MQNLRLKIILKPKSNLNETKNSQSEIKNLQKYPKHIPRIMDSWMKNHRKFKSHPADHGLVDEKLARI
jgi:hypothetical protein